MLIYIIIGMMVLWNLRPRYHPEWKEALKEQRKATHKDNIKRLKLFVIILPLSLTITALLIIWLA